MIKKLIISITLILLLVKPALSVSTSAYVEVLPGDWWGTVKINDQYISDNSIVAVYVNEDTTPITSTFVGNLKSNYYLVHVEASYGDNITFKVNNVPVEQSAQPWSDGEHELNLSITVNDSFSSSVSLNSNQVMTLDAINVTNTSLDIVTNSSVSGSVNIIKYSENLETSNFGVTSLNKYIQIEASSDISNALSWAIIKIYYTHDELNGIDENSLRIYYHNSTSGNWIPFNPPNDGGVDTVNHYVWANTTHFSFYGLFGSLPSCGDGSCNGNETCSSCVTDCGTCQQNGGGSVGGFSGGELSEAAPPTNKTAQNILAKTCQENWSCTYWSACQNNTQTRTCTDANKCETTVSKPVESQNCMEATNKIGNQKTLVPAGPTGLFLGVNLSGWATVIVLVVAVVLVIFSILKKEKK